MGNPTLWVSPFVYRSICSGTAPRAYLRNHYSLFSHPLFGLFDPIGVAVHVDQVSLVSQAIDHGGGQHRIAEDLTPAIEGQVSGDDGGFTWTYHSNPARRSAPYPATRSGANPASGWG